MRLLIDAGNTRVKWAIASSSADEILSSGVIAEDWSVLADFSGKIGAAWVSCVASDRTLSSIKAEVKELFDIEPHVIEVSASAAGMTNNYESLERLGVDRWVAALGARFLVSQGALIVVDAGTAVTIDLVSEENSFEGGVILPGFDIMHDALLSRTAGIESSRREVKSVVGRNTRDCVNAGLQYGLIGAVDRVITEMCTTVSGGSPRILVMGGDAQAIVSSSELEVELQLNMIFYGLMILSKK